MQPCRTITRRTNCANRSRLVLFAFGACMFAAVAIASPAKNDKPAAAQTAQPAACGFVGGEACATCHEGVAKRFAGNPHNRIAAMTSRARLVRLLEGSMVT